MSELGPRWGIDRVAFLQSQGLSYDQAVYQVQQERSTQGGSMSNVPYGIPGSTSVQGSAEGWWQPVATQLVGALGQRILGNSTAGGWEDFGPPTSAMNGAFPKRKRRRRRRLLTCSDKADIAFLHGQLGGGQLGRAAISSLLSRRCG